MRLLLLLSLGFSISAAPELCAAASPRPNILFLLTDDHRWNVLGCMGNGVVQTPHIDRLAADGVRFTNAFCTTAICMTSRASFLTGQYARRHGVETFNAMLPSEAFARTFPMLLKQQGYRVGFIGKWGVGNQLPQDAYDYWQGFAGQGRYFTAGESEHLTEKMQRQALEFLDSCTRETPFCLQISFKAAHCQDGDSWPFQPATRYDKLYSDMEIPQPANASKEAFERLPEFLQRSEGRVRWQVRHANPELNQKSLKDYYRLVTGVDDVVGQLINRLTQRGLVDNTLVIFTADNGMFLGEHGLADKWFMYEESIRLPLVIYDPRLPLAQRGKAIDAMALNIDIAPTILESAGLDVPAAIQGQSLRPLMFTESAADWRQEFFYEHNFAHRKIPRSEGVRGVRWKYVRYVDFEPPYEQLFDLRQDPLEMNNLAAQPELAEQLTHMRSRWQALRKQAE